MQRRASADAVIRDHVATSVAAAAIPIPIVDLLAVTAVQLSLLRQLGRLYGARVGIGAQGALAVGLLESFGSFWASAYKEVIVFSTILPVLLWRSLRDPHGEEH